MTASPAPLHHERSGREAVLIVGEIKRWSRQVDPTRRARESLDDLSFHSIPTTESLRVRRGEDDAATSEQVRSVVNESGVVVDRTPGADAFLLRARSEAGRIEDDQVVAQSAFACIG